MKKTIEMREKRAKLLTDMRKMLDENPEGLSGEQNQSYERMEKEFDTLGQDIEREERLEAFERELQTHMRKPLTDEQPGQRNKNDADKDMEYREAFFAFVRHGVNGVSDGQRELLKSRALVEGTNSLGGYLVPTMIANDILSGLNAESWIRSMANVYSTMNTNDIPTDESIPSFDWLAEGGTYQEKEQTFGQVVIGAHKTGGIIKVSEELLEDSAFDLEGHLSKKIITGFDAAEEQAFLTGDGSGKPTGVVTSAGTGTTAASATAITTDEVIDFVYSMLPRYRKDATIIGSTSFHKAVRKLKDSNGQYIWQPAFTKEGDDTLLGKPFKESEYMAAIATGAVPAVMANFKYYDVADRGSMYIQRLLEKYADTGMVGYRVRKRTEGKLTIASAAKKFVMG